MAGQVVKDLLRSFTAWWVVICVFVVGVSFSVFKVADYYDLATSSSFLSLAMELNALCGLYGKYSLSPMESTF